MNTTQQPEALRREYRSTMPREILHLWAVDALACIASLEAQLEAIGAGGVSALMMEAKEQQAGWQAALDELRLLLAASPAQPVAEPAKADSVLEDAARYRLLRRGQHWSVIDGIGNDLRAEALDAAVDAARKQGEKQ